MTQEKQLELDRNLKKNLSRSWYIACKLMLIYSLGGMMTCQRSIPRWLCHRLVIKNDARPVRQKTRYFKQERYEAINSEMEKLLKAGFIRKVNYHIHASIF